MDDAFHKLTHGRMEIHSLLMLRPKIVKAVPAPLPPDGPTTARQPAAEIRAAAQERQGKGKRQIQKRLGRVT